MDTLTEKWKLVPAYLKVKGLVKQHLDSFNYFIDVDLKQIVKANDRVDSDIDPQFFLQYTDIYIGTPQMEESMVTYDITPQQCRLRDLTYASPIMVDVQYVRGRQLVVRKGIVIGRMPIMLKSSRCILGQMGNNGETAGDEELKHARLGECPLDPGGYFIIKGTEKVILVQEQLSKNRIIVDLDRKGLPLASVTSSTHERKSKTYVVLKNGRMYLRHNSLNEDIPIFIAMKAMGIVSDEDAVTYIAGRDARLIQALAPSVEEWIASGLQTQAQALEGIGTKTKPAPRVPLSTTQSPRRSPVEEARELFASVILAHVPASPLQLARKGIYLALMARKLLHVHLGITGCDDRDYVGNKRLELAGQLLALLFEDCFKRYNSDLKRNIDRVLARQNRAQEFDAFPLLKLQTGIITHGIERSIATGNWNVKRFRMERAGITQVLSRLSYISALGMMTRITSQFEKTRKVSGPRSLQPSQWGMLCPSDTPEGEACGLVKNLALMTHVTTDTPHDQIVDLLYSLGVIDACLVRPVEVNSHRQVFLNGLLVGIIKDHLDLTNSLRKLRRAGLINPFVSVSLGGLESVHISADGGRICRPLLIVDEMGDAK